MNPSTNETPTPAEYSVAPLADAQSPKRERPKNRSDRCSSALALQNDRPATTSSE